MAYRIVLGILGAACAACSSTRPAMEAQPTTAAPVAERRPFTVRSPHGNREDEYYWLRDDTRKDPAMLDYLRAEHAYTSAMLAHTQGLQSTLYDEIVARIKKDDASVAYL